MKAELESILIGKHPGLFQDIDKSPQETCMCWRTEFGDGWYNIFKDLCEYLQLLSEQDMCLRTNVETEDLDKKYINVKYPDIKFAQTKEKYARLRVYWDMLPLENYEEVVKQLKDSKELDKEIDKYYGRVQNVVDYVEFLSSKVCEVCGEPGKVYTNGWYMTRCKKCIVDHYGFDPDEGEQKKF